MISRRSIIKLLAMTGALPLLGIGRLAWAADKNIVIVGGGSAGTIAASYLKKLMPELEITIVEKNKHYYPAFVSNFLISNVRKSTDNRFAYEAFKKRGINIIHDRVNEIDINQKKVVLAGGKSLPYDRLLLAHGVGFKHASIKGYNENTLHAWDASLQGERLAAEVAALKPGGLVVVSVPEGAISGPWAPFERVSQMATYFTEKNKKAKIVFLNGNKKPAEYALFEEYWQKRYPGMIEVQWQNQVTALAGNSVVTQAGKTNADLVNVIALNQAAALAINSGLTNEAGWCPVVPGTFESQMQAGIHIIGDAISPSLGLSKTAQSANAQAKVWAIAMANQLQGKAALQDLPPLIDSEYATLGSDYAVSRTKVFRIDVDKNLTLVSEGQSALNASQKQREREVTYAQSWINNITREMFA